MAAVSTHSRLKAAGRVLAELHQSGSVSTHSRLKAAGRCRRNARRGSSRFNTQPPEGGWVFSTSRRGSVISVSTHSRLKAAGCAVSFKIFHCGSFNTQPPEGGWPYVCQVVQFRLVSTHSRLKAAGFGQISRKIHIAVSTHSRLKAAGPNYRAFCA